MLVFFKGTSHIAIVDAIKNWLDLYTSKNLSYSDPPCYKTWREVGDEVKNVLINPKYGRTLASKSIREKALNEHLNYIHSARIRMVQNLLPQGDVILDLGGANSPLYEMGYTHNFKKLTLVDLPPDERHDYYKDVAIDDECPYGEVVIRYTDMTTLEGVEDESVDFVWSGQSIEHVPVEAGARMCREAFRVLKKGGTFCLDTPNRILTEIHTRSSGGGYIHPEHFIEYYPKDLKLLLEKAGFTIEHEYGICEMTETVATNEFHYEDFYIW